VFDVVDFDSIDSAEPPLEKSESVLGSLRYAHGDAYYSSVSSTGSIKLSRSSFLTPDFRVMMH
jgi:hypothetical protein